GRADDSGAQPAGLFHGGDLRANRPRRALGATPSRAHSQAPQSHASHELTINPPGLAMPRSTITSESVWPEHEEVIRRFEHAWAAGPRPSIATFMPADARLPALLLIELVHIDMEFRFRSSEQPRLEEYLQQFPGLDAERDVLNLLEYEIDLRY